MKTLLKMLFYALIKGGKRMPAKSKKKVEIKPLTHKELFELYKVCFADQGAKAWWKKGPNAIRVRISGGDVIFTYFSKEEWKVETPAIWEKSKDGI